jgi:hypothetical protein
MQKHVGGGMDLRYIPLGNVGIKALGHGKHATRAGNFSGIPQGQVLVKLNGILEPEINGMRVCTGTLKARMGQLLHTRVVFKYEKQTIEVAAPYLAYMAVMSVTLRTDHFPTSSLK